MPKGKIIMPDDTICLSGEGMPRYKNQDVKGDLFVTFEVEFPDSNWASNVDHAVSVVCYQKLSSRVLTTSLLNYNSGLDLLSARAGLGRLAPSKKARPRPSPRSCRRPSL